ncbi:MAG: phosphopantetheine-binding protein [Planctomycetaceae bacterium]
MTPSDRDVPAAVRAAIDAVYRDTGRPRREVPAAALLGADLGLDSLDLAQIVVLLERDLGVDPFRDPSPTAPRVPLRTVEHLVAAYRAALAAAPRPLPRAP